MCSFYCLEPRMDKSPFGNGFGPHPPGLSPMAAQFMALNNPAAAAQAAFFSQAGALPPFHGLPVTSSPGKTLFYWWLSVLVQNIMGLHLNMCFEPKLCYFEKLTN